MISSLTRFQSRAAFVEDRKVSNMRVAAEDLNGGMWIRSSNGLVYHSERTVRVSRPRGVVTNEQEQIYGIRSRTDSVREPLFLDHVCSLGDLRIIGVF